jgi:hypothetical protein
MLGMHNYFTTHKSVKEAGIGDQELCATPLIKICAKNIIYKICQV